MQGKKNKKAEQVLAEIVKQKDVGQVKSAIHEKYGFWPTDEYCRDLIAFVEVIAAEMMS